MTLSQCRLRIVEYFDQLINDLDLKTESTLAGRDLHESEIEQVNERRDTLIAHIKHLQEFNLASLDKSFKSSDDQIIDNTRLFRKFCFFIDASDKIEYNCFVDQLFGHFVIVDRYVDADTLAAFRELQSYNKNRREVPEENLLFEFNHEEYYEPQFEIGSDFYQPDRLVAETTVHDLFKLNYAYFEDGTIESIKVPARDLFSNIQRVDFTFDSFTPRAFSQTLKLIGTSADRVGLVYRADDYEPDMFASLSDDIKIKVLELTSIDHAHQSILNHLNHLEKLTIYIGQGVAVSDDVFRHLTTLKSLDIRFESNKSFSLSVLAPLIELEELVIESDQVVSVEYSSSSPAIRLDRLRKLRLDGVQVDIRFIESLPSLRELEMDNVAKMAELVKKKKPVFMKQLERLDITNSLLLKLDSKSFDGLQLLTSLNLSSNQITEINKNALFDMKNLSSLDLSHNELVAVKSDAINGLTSLTTLNLSNNNVDSVNENLFQKLRLSLTHLDLSFNTLTYLSGSFCLNKLKELHLSNNSIVNVERSVFDELVELELLDLSKNKIKSIKSNTFQQLGKLQRLCLNNNGLTSIDADFFSGLTSLQHLDLTDNEISLIDPTSFSPLVSLEVLFLDQNKLKRIEPIDSLFHLKSLKRLHLSQNTIETLPSFSGLEQLIQLDLSNNSISYIERSVFSTLDDASMSRLTDLDLGANSITRIDSNTFSSLRRLENLCLVQNEISVLDKDSLAGLERLKHLNLCGNRIERLEPELFKEQRRLKSLELVDNRLREIKSDTFSPSLTSLEELNLSYNEINFIQANAFAPLLRLRVLNLNGNSDMFVNLDPQLLGLSAKCQLLYPKRSMAM